MQLRTMLHESATPEGSLIKYELHLPRSATAQFAAGRPFAAVLASADAGAGPQCTLQKA